MRSLIKLNSLPSQIVVLVSAVLLAVLLALWVFLLSVRSTMDRDAAEDSRKRMMGRVAAMQEQVSLIASDYHNWTDLYLNAKQLDIDRLATNYGITAVRGDVFQYAELFDGPIADSLSWEFGGGMMPEGGFLAPETRDVLRTTVRDLDYQQRQVFDYFEMRDSHLVMFSGSYLLPENDSILENVVLAQTAVAVIGKVLENDRLAEVAREFSISNLQVTLSPPAADTVAIPVAGVTGAPIAWLQWEPPRHGSLLFSKMVPVMSAVSLTFFLISISAALLLRAKAAELVSQEAHSYIKARTDALTGLANRVSLREHLVQLSNDGKNGCAVVAIDLVRFKQINDTVGHNGGDVFLVEFAQRLSKLADETTFVSRYGGDEFFLAISTEGDLQTLVEEKCRKIVTVSNTPICCNGVSFEALASKGVALRDHPLNDLDEILRRADRAMYFAKARGTQDVVFYDDRMMLKDMEHKRIEAELRRALVDGNGFEMFYQPIVPSNQIERVAHYEALARWTSPKLGQVEPEKFIQVAEATALILPLGWRLLDLVCRDMKFLGQAQVNVNISPTQLMSPGFAESFADRVAEHGIDAGRIELEVTEQIVMHDHVTIGQELRTLSRRGFSLALDDFGTGYASIGYLTQMPFDVLKIDRSFVREIDENQSSIRMIRSITGLAQAMDLKIVAEGIETADDARALRAIGVDFLQGYHLGVPAPLSFHMQVQTAAVVC